MKHELFSSFPFPHFYFPFEEDHPFPKYSALSAHCSSRGQYALTPLFSLSAFKYKRIMRNTDSSGAFEEFSKLFNAIYVLHGLYWNTFILQEWDIFLSSITVIKIIFVKICDLSKYIVPLIKICIKDFTVSWIASLLHYLILI